MQLSLSQIPSNIDTVEKLVAWGLMLLENQIGTMQVKEDANSLPSNVVQVQITRVADDTVRLMGRISLPLAETYATNNSVKFWQHITPLTNTTIPTGFLNN